MTSSSRAAPSAPNLAPYWIFHPARIGVSVLAQFTVYFTAIDLNQAQLSALQIAAYQGDPATGGSQVASTAAFTETQPGIYYTQLAWIPQTTGVFTLYAMLDPANLIPEANENDNWITVTVEVVPPRSDLMVFDVSGSAALAIGLPAERLLWVWNSGDAAAQNVTVNVYLGDPRASGQLIGSSAVIASLAAKAGVALPVVITPTQLGTHSIYAWVDPNDAIAEYSEDNNLTWRTVQVREGQLTWYVDNSVAASGDGRTPATAFKTITEAMAVAVMSDTVVVAPGRYVGGIEVPAGVTLKGAGRNETFIDGTGAAYVSVWLNKASHIEGFTLSGSDPSNGGFTRGIQLLAQATVQHNRVSAYSIGIDAACGSGHWGSPCQGRAVIAGNIVDGNRQIGINLVDLMATVRNNTVVWNDQIGINAYTSAVALIENNLVYSNGVQSINAPFSSTVQYNLVFPAPIWYQPNLTGTGMLMMDPMLRDAAVGNYRLRAGSPARKRGNPTGTDIGALPFSPVGAPPSGLVITPQPEGTWLATWQGNGAAGYALYVGEQPGLYSRRLDTGTETVQVLSGLLGGATYYVAVSAYNGTGDESELSPEQSFTVPPLGNGVHQENHPQLRYQGSWQRVSDARASGGSYMTAASNGDSVEFVFTGDQIVIYRRVAPELGEAQVYIDGVLLGNMTFNSEVERWQVPSIFDRLGPGQHRLTLRLINWSVPKPINIDAIEIPGAFAPTSYQLQAVARVNYFRDQAGLPKASGVMALHQGAQSHAEFVADNKNDPRIAGLGFHSEYPDLPGFVGRWPSDRARYFGYTGGVGEDGHFIGDPIGSVDGWMETVYHRTLILCFSCVDAGYGRVNDGRGRFDVLKMGSRLNTSPALPSTRRMIVYPAPGQLDVQTAWSGGEIPDPLPGLPRPVGYPISLQIIQPSLSQLPQVAQTVFDPFMIRPGPGWFVQTPAIGPSTVLSWTLTLAELRNSRQELVPIYVLDKDSDPAKFLGPDIVFIIAKAPLQEDETYIARFVGTDSRGQPFDVRSAFSTGSQLAVANLTIGAVRASPLTPVAGQRVDYEIKLRNSNAQARDIAIAIDLPGQVTLVLGSVSSSAGVVSGDGPLMLTIDTLAANQVVTIRYAVTVGATVTQPAMLRTRLNLRWNAGVSSVESVIIANGKAMYLPAVQQ